VAATAQVVRFPATFKLSVNTLKSWTRFKVAVFQLAKHAPKQKRMRHFIKFAALPAMLSAELENAADEGREYMGREGVDGEVPRMPLVVAHTEVVTWFRQEVNDCGLAVVRHAAFPLGLPNPEACGRVRLERGFRAAL